jgi:ferric-dicitrate binding protein FerR (iron transport regulator)
MEIKDFNQQADDLIAGYLSGELAPEETEKLINWIKQSKENKQHYDECCELWITVKAASGNSEFDPDRGFIEFRRKINIREKAFILSLSFLRYAAIFILAFSLGGGIFYFSGKKSVPEIISEVFVPRGSQAKITLPDGSKVTLNAGSSLNYENRPDQRIARLEGEGYFTIAKNTERPFTVVTGYMNVVATGTEFNVRAYPSESIIEATLISGSVTIEKLSGGTSEPTVLKPNQKFTYYKERKPDSTQAEPTRIVQDQINTAPVSSPEKAMGLIMENVNVESIISWKDSRWIFEAETLSHIATELERKYDVEIQFESERLKSFRFTGIIVNEPIEQVLEVMSASAPLTYSLKGRVVTLSENKKFEELNKNLYNPD